MIFSFGELFCGPGGLGLGAKEANIGQPDWSIKHIWANDFDADTCATYTRNICPDDPKSVICKDVRDLDIKALPPIDSLAFGFPCNDFSVVGEQKGFDGKYGPLYTYGVRTLKEHQPKWFLAENVSGLRSANEGKALGIILRDMRRAGYRLYPNLYKFEEYGIPQARHRIIVVGIRKDIPVEYSVPSTDGYSVETAKDALECPPIAPDAPNNEQHLLTGKALERMKYIKPGQNAFSASMPSELRLHIKGAKISQIYRRLEPDKPAYTVTGSGGGGTYMYHWSENRSLTNRERARLQTFPDDFVFIGSRQSVRKQIGMAVPPRGARIIFEAILKSFAGIGYRSMPANMDDHGRPVK